jgi:phage terminase large subunit
MGITKTTTAYRKIDSVATKIAVIQGGMSAGKNYAIAQILTRKAYEKPRMITIMTDTFQNLIDGSVQDFKHIFEDLGLDWDKCYNKSSHEIHLMDSTIQFRYISDNKVGAGKSKRRDILYLNEANRFGWEVASGYIGRTHEKVYLDYNPDNEFWAHTQLQKLTDDNGKPLSSQIIVTYLDNELCPEAERRFIESRRDNESWWRVYALGLTGFYSERRIYSFNFYQVIPATARRISSGMDFGISPDPTVLVDVWKKDNCLYVDEVFSMNNLMPEKINGSERMAIVDQLAHVNHLKGLQIIADSAGRTEINDMRKHGYNIRGVKKHPGSVMTGVNKLRGYDIFISERSVNLKAGLEKWFWKIDTNGKIIPEPDGHEPDGLAALRYVVMELSHLEFSTTKK